jgi:hypothetical protein
MTHFMNRGGWHRRQSYLRHAWLLLLGIDSVQVPADNSHLIINYPGNDRIGRSGGRDRRIVVQDQMVGSILLSVQRE